jgi:hypothetical protein
MSDCGFLFFWYYDLLRLVTHAKHGEPNAGLGHDEHGALDDARRLDVPPASRTDQETANQTIAAAAAQVLMERKDLRNAKLFF